MDEPGSPTRVEGGAPRVWLALTGLATAAVLTLLIPRQVFDTNFYSLWEATNLLAGDHPYRDFFEWGVPLQAVLSAAMQWVVGYRMVGEFIFVHWPFIIAGAVISFDLGYRLTRSIPVTVITALMALAVLPATPTFHYPKLFIYPAGIWLAWRYLDRPGIRSAAMLGILTAVAFLFRHDHGVYIGVASVLACVLARLSVPGRPWRQTIRESGVYTATVTLLLLPWLILVQGGEGLPDYVRTRADLFEMWSGERAYTAILRRSPLAFTEGWTPPPPRAGAVKMRWLDEVDERARLELERKHGLRQPQGPDGDKRWSYQVDNVYAGHLYDLKPLVNDTEGLDWERLEALSAWLPALEPARVWLAQVTMLVPLLLLGSAGLALARNLAERTPPSTRSLRLLLTGTVLILVDAKLFREVSYAHLVAPLTAAMVAPFLMRPRQPGVLGWTRFAVAGVLAAVTAFNALACADLDVLLARENRQSIPNIYRRMWLHPPIDMPITRAEADRLMAENDYEKWARNEVGAWPEILIRYVHDCTAGADRVLVTGQTPFQVGYLLERPVGGGHVFWHHRWRTDPEHERGLLDLIRSQTIPFAFSTHDPVFVDLEAYPRIHQYFEEHYREVPGSSGHLLVDARRQPVSTFGPYGLPCFK